MKGWPSLVDVCFVMLAKRSLAWVVAVSRTTTSSKHVLKKRLDSTQTRECDIAHALAKYSEEVHVKGETLPSACWCSSIKVGPFSWPVRGECLQAEWLPSYGWSNSFCAEARAEIEGSNIAIILDGTSCLGEALAVVHYVTEDFKQCLIWLQLLAKSLSRVEIARKIITIVSVGFGV